MTKENLSKEYKHFYILANNILGNILTNTIIKNKLISNADNSLKSYILEIISYQNYIETYLKMEKNHLSLNYAQVVSNFLNRKIELFSYDELNPKKILIDINFLKTYVQNIYHISKSNLEKTFDTTSVKELLFVAKRDRLLFKKRIIQNSMSSKNNINRTPAILRADFYPYKSKNKFVIWFKFGISILLAIFCILIIAIAFTSKNSTSIIYFGIIDILILGGNIYYLMKPIFSNILRIKYIYNYVYMLFNLIPTLVACFLILANTIGINHWNLIFVGVSNILVFASLVVTLLIVICSIICVIISPKLDKVMFEKAKREFVKYQQNIINNFKNKNTNNDKFNTDGNEIDSDDIDEDK